uniref:Uncharacterized protein n=1 Tax=Peronospora matthiolae TaxID=2874970 RepID=A0AAV1TR55_9STRA
MSDRNHCLKSYGHHGLRKNLTNEVETQRADAKRPDRRVTADQSESAGMVATRLSGESGGDLAPQFAETLLTAHYAK